ncbi:major facilitator superfamily domain-containing protein [Xylariomycetidae sp. FL0641]|nr:major facilitator superfamily domain-containing protein [Xylariomycetidae sp. FL0641]
MKDSMDEKKSPKGQGHGASLSGVTAVERDDYTRLEKKDGNEKDPHTDSESSSTLEEGRTSTASSESEPAPEPRASQILSRTVSEVRDGIENRRDLELGESDSEKNRRHSTTSSTTTDPDLVTWDGPDDPANPKNWPYPAKWGAVFIVSIFTLISPVSSSMVAPSLETIGNELNISSTLEQNLVLSIFVLAYALGPLVWGPLSELYGRVIILQLANLIYLFFNLGCGLARTPAELIAFRFVSGFGGSAPLAIGGGVLGDLFPAEQRGRAMSIYSLAPLLGPAIGPLAGAFITQNTTWRWAFWATTIADAAIQAAGLLWLRETYAPVLLAWKRDRLAKTTGRDGLRTPYDGASRKVVRSLMTALVRPFRLLASQPIVQCLALYMMYLYGLMYLMLSSFPGLFSGPEPEGYGMPLGLGGLNYISLGLGFLLGGQVCAPLQDKIYVRLKQKVGRGVGRPEFRVPMMLPGAVLVPAGLLIYGWCAEFKTHWIFPNIGATLFATGTIIGFQCLQGFLVDSYTRFAASAVGAATVLRSLAGFGFPLFAPAMYGRLGYGWGNTVLALLGCALGLPGPFLLWRYGERLRLRSQFAAGGF